MRVSRYVRLTLGLLILASLLASSFSLVGAQEKVLRYNLGPGELPTADPALATDTSSGLVVESAFVGLTAQDEVDGSTHPGMATSWDVSEDGLIYTFHLMEGVPWVKWDADAGAVVESTDADGNVRYVNASDFAYGIKRHLSPELASEYAYLPADWIVGGYDYNAGEADADSVGVTVIDDYTLEIQVTQSASFVPAILGLWLLVATPEWAITEFGETWTEPGNYETYGAFTVSEWNHDQDITLVKNPFWPGIEQHPQAQIDKVYMPFLDADAALANYEAGELDVSSVPTSEVDRVEAQYPDEVVSNPRFCTSYYGFNVSKPPMDNVHLRRAFTYAIDRVDLLDAISSKSEPAQWFSRPGLVGAPTMETHPELGAKFDPELAQAELALALEDLGLSSVDELPAIALGFNEAESNVAFAEVHQEMWVEVLGIEVQFQVSEWAVYLKTLNEDPAQIWRLGWCADYPDAHNFLSDVFYSTSGNNHTYWANEEYDAILDEAKTLDDVEARTELYARAEEILTVEDAVIIPQAWSVSFGLTKSNVERTLQQAGRARLSKWAVN